MKVYEMKLLFKILLLISYSSHNDAFYLSATEFTDIISSSGYCEDSESITIDINLKSLEIYDCRKIFPLQSAVYSFKIIYLILRANEITNLTKGDFKELVTVKNLQIIRNDVRQMHANTLESLKHLKHLTIVEPHLRLKNLILYNDCKLEKLHLELQSFDSQMLSTLPNEMTKVTIENTPALSSEFSIPNNLINLIYLRLRNCSIENWNETEVTFSALEHLDLSHNKLKDIPLMSEKYSNLITLILSYNEISSLGEKAVESLRSLEILELDNNKIHSVHTNAFSTNMNLAAVDLSHNSLSLIDLNYTNFHKYRVDINSNPISFGDRDKTPSYINTEVIECHGKLYSAMIILVILLSVCAFIIALVFLYRKRWWKERGYPSPQHDFAPFRVTQEMLSSTKSRKERESGTATQPLAS